MMPFSRIDSANSFSEVVVEPVSRLHCARENLAGRHLVGRLGGCGGWRACRFFSAFGFLVSRRAGTQQGTQASA